MMRLAVIVCLTLFFSFLAEPVWADRFQLLYRTESDATYRVGYAPVVVLDASKKTVFKGSTDNYGRIVINLNKGSYEGRVTYRRADWTVRLVIDGRTELKTVYLSKR